MRRTGRRATAAAAIDPCAEQSPRPYWFFFFLSPGRMNLGCRLLPIRPVRFARRLPVEISASSSVAQSEAAAAGRSSFYASSGSFPF